MSRAQPERRAVSRPRALLELLGLWPTAHDRRVRAEIEREIADELEHHLELATDELVHEGLEPAAARAEAERRFGDRARHAETCRRTRMGERIMLHRLHVALTCLLVPTFLWLLWANTVARHEARASVQQALAERERALHVIAEARERASTPLEPAEVVLAIGDVLEVTSEMYASEIDTRTTVERDGTALFPEIGRLDVHGMERDELELRLHERYYDYFDLIPTPADPDFRRDIHVRVHPAGGQVLPGPPEPEER